METKYRVGELLFRVMDDLTSYLENLKQQDCIVDYKIGNHGLSVEAQLVVTTPFKYIEVELILEED